MQKYRVRFFVTRAYDIEVDAHTEANARLQAKIRLCEGRGKGFKKGQDLWVIEAWADPINTPQGAGMTYTGNLDHPLFIVPARNSSPVGPAA
jgi:hypothetical protein